MAKKVQDIAKEFEALLEEARAEGYQEGYELGHHDGFRQALEFAASMLPTLEPPTSPKPSETTSRAVAAEVSERRPAGENKAIVESALESAGDHGLRQAEIIRRTEQLGHPVPQSSVRHALKQLQQEGRVRPIGRRWQRVSSAPEETSEPVF